MVKCAFIRTQIPVCSIFTADKAEFARFSTLTARCMWGLTVETMATALLGAALAGALILVCLARLRAEKRRQSKKEGLKEWTSPKRKKS